MFHIPLKLVQDLNMISEPCIVSKLHHKTTELKRAKMQLIIISAIYTLLLSLKLILSGVKHKLRVTQVVEN